jgi:hypothetical protein
MKSTPLAHQPPISLPSLKAALKELVQAMARHAAEEDVKK